MAQLPATVLLEKNKIFGEYKGALTEQYALQQLATLGGTLPYYWTNNRGSAEVDFIVPIGNYIIPLEVKAETNLMAKSLRVYADTFKPLVSIRTSMTNYKKEEWLINLPLYAIHTIEAEVRNF